ENGRVVAMAGLACAAAESGEHEQDGRERHHGEAEQPAARPATPDEVDADDEPDKEVQRAGPGRPREALGARSLDDEQAGLEQPADAHAPGRQAAGGAWTTRIPRVGDRGLAVGE